MSALPLAITATGLVTSVGLTAPQSCAAFRAKISNPSETRFIGSDGQWIMAHQVVLEQPWRGLTKLAKMAAMAIEETLQSVPREEWAGIPLLLCVAEAERPGRQEGLDDELLALVERELGSRFQPEQSGIVPQGRVGVAVALRRAREWLGAQDVNAAPARVLIAATDSLLCWPTLSHYEREDRLLTERNSNGFMPGEGAGALLVQPAAGQPSELVCTGLGFGRETALISSEEPLRAEGLASAIKAALTDTGCAMHDIDYRVTDLSGEHYYFKEAALALSRTLRQRKEEFDIWHPAECTGEAGAATGINVIALARAAAAKGYAKGPRVMAHWANDGGQRCAAVFERRSAGRAAGGAA
jgi:3-oxoacyl-[acyl-carrier-protein] synthase I